MVYKYVFVFNRWTEKSSISRYTNNIVGNFNSGISIPTLIIISDLRISAKVRNTVGEENLGELNPKCNIGKLWSRPDPGNERRAKHDEKSCIIANFDRKEQALSTIVVDIKHVRKTLTKCAE